MKRSSTCVVIVAVQVKGKARKITAIVPATDANLILAKKIAEESKQPEKQGSSSGL
jgi:hypothetical protein